MGVGKTTTHQEIHDEAKTQKDALYMGVDFKQSKQKSKPKKKKD